MEAPSGLGEGGSALWESMNPAGMTERDRALLTEACRMRDRLDRLNDLLNGDEELWMRVMHNARTEDYEIKVDDALNKATSVAAGLRQLLAALPEPAAPAVETRSPLDELANRRSGRGATA